MNEEINEFNDMSELPITAPPATQHMLPYHEQQRLLTIMKNYQVEAN